jgi:beta-glucosidase
MTLRIILLSITLASVPMSACPQTISKPKPVASTSEFIYADRNAPLEARVEDLLKRLTLEEKIRLLHGDIMHTPGAPGERFYAGGVERLNIPKITFLDGRQGVRTFDKLNRGYNKGIGEVIPEGLIQTTALPSTLSISCSWDMDIVSSYGELLANEMLGVKRHVLFAPMINLIRTPLNGRNFENLGEDPFLAGQTAVAYIQGVQKKNVAACGCLLVANDYESNRHWTSSNMDERTLREVHMLPYEMAAREGKVWTMMSANSLLNGIHCAHNAELQQSLLKDEIGFDGVMLTDWRAAYYAVDAALGGTDMTTGICAYVFGDGKLLQAVKDGLVPEALIDDKARRVIRLMIRTGVLNPEMLEEGAIDSEEHRAIARRLGSEGMVLLKNEGSLLPLNPDNMRNLVVMGPGATTVAKGTGSGNVISKLNVTPLEGLREALTGTTELTHVPYTALEETLSETADKTTENADAVIFFATSAHYSEGTSLTSMELPDAQNEAINRLSKINKNLIVVLMTGSAVLVEPWVDDVPAILGAWFAGQSTGHSIADVLLGKFNPGGKLSFTMAKKIEDYPVHHFGEWPAKLILDEAPRELPEQPELRKAIHGYSGEYKEGVFVGHRWFEEKNIEPRFEFGYGLSYTNFEMSRLRLRQTNDSITITCSVKNTGDRAGSEVVQVYVSPPESSVPRPKKELKGFRKVHLEKGEKQKVEITIPVSRLTYYNATGKNWKLEAGDYGIHLGNSSRNIVLSGRLKYNQVRIFEKY